MEKIKLIIDKIKDGKKTEVPKDVEWREFKLNEILKILSSGKELTNTNNNEGIYPLVVAKKDNNGVGKFINSGRLKFNGNKIVMIKTGDGGAGLSYYHKNDFFATTSIMVLEENKEKFNWKLNENIGLFLITMMKKYKNFFNHSNGINEEKYNNLKISLPSKNNQPDWEYMDKFIENLKKVMKIDLSPPLSLSLSIITLINKIKNSKKTEILKDVEWREFKLNEIFSTPMIGKDTINSSEDGNINLVSSCENNNGVARKIKNGKKLFNGNKLTLSKNGSVGTLYYQNENFYATSDVIILSNKNLNKNIGLFLKIAIEKYTKKFNWDNKITIPKYNNLKISLPSKNNQPDWEYMDKFIENLKLKLKLNI